MGAHLFVLSSLSPTLCDLPGCGVSTCADVVCRVLSQCAMPTIWIGLSFSTLSHLQVLIFVRPVSKSIIPQTVYCWGSILERKELATLTGWALSLGLVLLLSSSWPRP